MHQWQMAWYAYLATCVEELGMSAGSDDTEGSLSPRMLLARLVSVTLTLFIVRARPSALATIESTVASIESQVS